MVIRPMRAPDLGAVVAIHVESFPRFFLTFLGPRFLELLYESMLTDPDGVILVAEAEGSPVGFVAGVTRQEGFYRRLIRRRLVAFALASARAAARRPSIIPRLVRALHRPGESAQSVADACLMSLAVSPRSQSRGVGAQLVRAFLQTLAGRGVTTVCLTTDRDGNDKVNQFYENAGFRVGRTFVTAEGRPMNEFVIRIDEG